MVMLWIGKMWRSRDVNSPKRGLIFTTKLYMVKTFVSLLSGHSFYLNLSPWYTYGSRDSLVGTVTSLGDSWFRVRNPVKTSKFSPLQNFINLSLARPAFHSRGSRVLSEGKMARPWSLTHCHVTPRLGMREAPLTLHAFTALTRTSPLYTFEVN
jgi:hypothetical protein